MPHGPGLGPHGPGLGPHAVVGLGNPGAEYAGTRHNVGQRVLDLLVRRLRARFHRDKRAHVAHAAWNGEAVALIKLQSFMNVSGPAVAAALDQVGASAEDLILVHDDIDLPLGTVRVRMKGSHGGHRGVRSVIETLGTSDIKRVKIGIGRPTTRGDVADHVLSRFEVDELPAVDQAVAEAAERVLALIRS